jgi:hypothetical protein
VRWGLGEPEPRSFLDPRLAAVPGTTNSYGLNIKRARFITHWDYDPNHGAPSPAVQASRYDIDEWLKMVESRCIEPLISFGYGAEHPMALPSVDEYGAHVQTFIDMHPEIKYYTAWNEPNLKGAGKGTYGHLFRAGQYHRRLAKICQDAGCVAIAFDWSDRVLRKADFDDYVDGAGGPGNIDIIGYHAYGLPAQPETVRERFNQFRGYADRINASLWLTEQGGRVIGGDSHWSNEPPPDQKKRTSNERQATTQAKEIIDLPTGHTRVKRFYYYSWVGAGGWAGNRPWDSGLVNYRLFDLSLDGLPPGALYKQHIKWTAREQFAYYKQKTNP